MGWDFCSDWRSRADVKLALLRDWQHAGLTVLATSEGRKYDATHVWWVALEAPSKGGTDNVSFIACVLIEPDAAPQQKNRPLSYGCKIMDESMGPAFYCCPQNVFQAATGPDSDCAREWRQRVLRSAPWAQHHARCSTQVDPVLRCTCERERDYDRTVRS